MWCVACVVCFVLFFCVLCFVGHAREDETARVSVYVCVCDLGGGCFMRGIFFAGSFPSHWPLACVCLFWTPPEFSPEVCFVNNTFSLPSFRSFAFAWPVKVAPRPVWLGDGGSMESGGLQRRATTETNPDCNSYICTETISQEVLNQLGQCPGVLCAYSAHFLTGLSKNT